MIGRISGVAIAVSIVPALGFAEVPDKMVAYFNVDSGCASPGADWGEAQSAHGRLVMAYAPAVSAQPSAEAADACTNGGPAAACVGQLLGTSLDLSDRAYQLP